MGLIASDATIELAVEREVVRPGEEIVVSASLGGDPDEKIQGGSRVELLLRQHYRVKSRDRNGGREIDTRRLETVFAAHPLTEHGAATTFPVRFAENAPPTAPGIVEWLVRAKLNRRLAVDTWAHKPFTVVAPRAAGAWRAGTPPTVDEECGLELRPASRDAMPGKAIEGTVHVAPREELEVEEIRIELVLERADTHDRIPIRREQVVERVRVAPAGVMPAGIAAGFPFAVTVPADAVPSLKAQYTEMRWFLAAVVSRSMKRDHNVRMECNVHNAA